MLRGVTQYMLVERYYHNIIFAWPLCPDVQLLILTWVMGMYMYQVRKKHLHFFEHQVLIFQTVAIEPKFLSRSFCFIPQKYATYVFDHVNSKMISYPFTNTVLNCTYRHLQNTWLQLCDYVVDHWQEMHVVYICNWRVCIEDRDFKGLPILYYATDVLKNKLQTLIEHLGRKSYNENFIYFD